MDPVGHCFLPSDDYLCTGLKAHCPDTAVHKWRGRSRDYFSHCRIRFALRESFGWHARGHLCGLPMHVTPSVSFQNSVSLREFRSFCVDA
eukprot:6190423-Pleurochrysis_carterae.AAC.2